MDCDIDAYIPASYIKNEYQKLDIYKRISGIESEEEYMDMQDELIDRFGEIPGPVENLLRVAALKALAHRAGVTDVFINRREVRLVMFKRRDRCDRHSRAHRKIQGRSEAAPRRCPGVSLPGSEEQE